MASSNKMEQKMGVVISSNNDVENKDNTKNSEKVAINDKNLFPAHPDDDSEQPSRKRLKSFDEKESRWHIIPGCRGKSRVSPLLNIQLLSSLQHPHLLNRGDGKISALVSSDKNNRRYQFGRYDIAVPEASYDLYEAVISGNIKDAKLRRVLYQVCLAVQHLHNNGIIHTDIKLDNILIFPDRAVLADFDLSQMTDRAGEIITSDASLGSIQYMPIEIYRGILHSNLLPINHQYGPATDIWSLGATILLAFTLRPITANDTICAEDYQRLQFLPTYISRCSKKITYRPDDFCDLLSAMLNSDSKKRITITEVINHPYFREEKEKHNVINNKAEFIPKIPEIPEIVRYNIQILRIDIFREILQDFVTITRELYPQASLRILLLSLDIFYRLIEIRTPDISAITIFYMALRLYHPTVGTTHYDVEIIPPYYSIEFENLYLQSLQGKIFYKNLYHRYHDCGKLREIWREITQEPIKYYQYMSTPLTDDPLLANVTACDFLQLL